MWERRRFLEACGSASMAGLGWMWSRTRPAVAAVPDELLAGTLARPGTAMSAGLILLRFGAEGSEKPGLLDPQGNIRDLSGQLADWTPDQLADENLSRIASLPLAQLPLVSDDVRLAAPISGVSKIIAIGFNYVDHAAEMAVELPTEPLIFMKAVSALSNPSDPIISPRGATKLDYESELVVVIGRKAQYVPVDEALSYVAGYTAGNDVSERAFQRDRAGQFTKGKSADSFAPFGPLLVTRDRVANVQNLRLWSEVNGQLRQDGNTSQMVFGVAEIVSYLSQFMTLMPGDLIYTGTPEGVGDGMNPPQYLRPGDVVRVGIDGIGEMRQTVVAPR